MGVRNSNGTVKRHLRLKLWRRQKGKCAICEDTLNRPGKNARAVTGNSPTLDHIIPLFQGGADNRGNVQLAHYRCNQEKGAGEGFAEILAARGYTPPSLLP